MRSYFDLSLRFSFLSFSQQGLSCWHLFIASSAKSWKSYVSLVVIGFCDKPFEMELRHLRYFAAVAKHLSYSEASRHLNVAQPAISQTILDLEDELAVKLLFRTKRTVQLTTAGTTFLREADEILRRAAEAQRLAQRAARGEVGSLGIGFFGTASGPILPMHAYRRKFPDVELRLYELNPDQQLAAFDEGRIDLGFSRALPTERRSEFEEELVYTDHLVIALPAAHSLAKQKVI